MKNTKNGKSDQISPVMGDMSNGQGRLDQVSHMTMFCKH